MYVGMRQALFSALLRATGLNSWLCRKQCNDPNLASAYKVRACACVVLLFLPPPFLDVVVPHYRMQDVMPKEHRQNQDLALSPARAQQREFLAPWSFSLKGETVGGCQKLSETPAGTGNYFNA